MIAKVAVGLSGGVDSAVSAALLKKAGYDVVGVYLHCFPADFEKTLDCTDKEDFEMAQTVAKSQDIPFTFFDLEKAYQEKVIDYFFREYKAGRTPNPDAVCNKEIKFGLFLERALQELGADFVATGHYSRVATKVKSQNSKLKSESKNSKVYHLLQGKDHTKDQSYFLYNLSQKQLSRILFPVGGYAKAQVRQMARDFGLPNWQRKDSQGICFLGKISVRDFLEQKIKPKKGEVVDTAGRTIGEHDGVWFYTIGQRHGFKIKSKVKSQKSKVIEPLYVVNKDVENNRLVVGWGKECQRSEFLVERINWIDGKVKEGDCRVRIRHLGELYPCRLNCVSHNTCHAEFISASVSRRILNQVQDDKGWKSSKIRDKVGVVLREPAWGVAPGQVAVFYDKDEVLGGGVIV